MIQSMSSASLQEELEALRRELSQTPIMEEVEAAAAAKASTDAPGADTEIGKTLRDLQEKLAETADEAEDLIAAHPFASVAAAFLLGVLVANILSRGK
jgi:ElaB/YqjD/DUF883 family membrane-anchored ribosome-binding protein